ncbi:PaaI family thioesterase [Sphingomonas sp. IW22]|uniref:PaaI family thioesterase n=1 Tax=Sphingomonas sp. IW22 TaxID=3242489 RepID=UPI00351FCAF9
MSLPPYAQLLGLRVEPGDSGVPRLVMPFGNAVTGRPGFVHGGAIGGLVEMAAVAALRHALADEGVGLKPINLTVDYMRGGRDRDTLAEGVVVRLGTRIANVEAFAWQEARDHPIAAARINFLLSR